MRTLTAIICDSCGSISPSELDYCIACGKPQNQPEAFATAEAKGGSLERVVSPLACPFCGVEAKEHGGDYVLEHTTECFFTQQYAQEMWLVGKRKVRIWNKRANTKLTDRLEQKEQNE